MQDQGQLEAAALGYVIAGMADSVMPLQPALFTIETNRLIAVAIGKASDPESLPQLMDALGDDLERAGGFSYLTDLADSWSPFGTLGGPEVVRILRERAENRRRANIALDISRMAQQGEPIQGLIESLLGSEYVAEDKFPTAIEAVTAAIARHKEIRDNPKARVPIAVAGMETMYGLEPGHLCVIGARAKIGKTALALQIAYLAAVRGHKTAYFSMEMPAYQLGGRLVSQVSGVPLIPGEEITPGRQQALDRAQARIKGVSDLLAIIDQVDTDDALYAVIRRLARAGTELFVVDYLGLIRPVRAAERRDLEIAAITRNLKRLAVKLGISIIVLAQINRESQKTAGRKPELHHLRESGAIEADADLVLLIWREQDDSGLPTEHGEIIVAANRHGPTDSFPIMFRGSAVRFEVGDVEGR